MWQFPEHKTLRTARDEISHLAASLRIAT